MDETLPAKLIRVRREIHANPGFSNWEVETTALIRRELEAAGVSLIYPLEHSGLIAEIRGSRPGPIVAIRADLDALPIQEATDVPFRSRRDGVMHACGHDVHAAMVLGVGVAARDEIPVGTIRLIFQPAEEAEPLGARKVITAGFVDDVCGVVALHVDPALVTGRLALRNGPMMASSDVFTLIVTGRNAHAGWPQDGVDAIAAAAAVISHTHAALTRRIDPRAGAVIHFGRINGGTANNVVADRVQVDGVIRTLDPTARDRLASILEAAARAASAIYGACCEVEITAGEPVLTNDPWLSDRLRAAGREVLGAEGVLEPKRRP